MKKREETNRNTKVWVDVDLPTLEALDHECQMRGGCSRMSLLRLVLMERYGLLPAKRVVIAG